MQCTNDAQDINEVDPAKNNCNNTCGLRARRAAVPNGHNSYHARQRPREGASAGLLSDGTYSETTVSPAARSEAAVRRVGRASVGAEDVLFANSRGEPARPRAVRLGDRERNALVLASDSPA